MEPTGRCSLKRHRPYSVFIGCFLQDPHPEADRHQSDDSDFFFLGTGSEHEAAMAAAALDGRRRETQACSKALSSWLCVSWWEEITLPSSRRLKKRKKVQEEEEGEDVNGCCHRPPPAWKRLVRRLRAAAKKASRERALSFRYDALSYSLNFDDGCWQHSQSHARLYAPVPTPHHLCNPVFAAARPSLWQRRRVRQPLALDVAMDRA